MYMIQGFEFCSLWVCCFTCRRKCENSGQLSVVVLELGARDHRNTRLCSWPVDLIAMQLAWDNEAPVTNEGTLSLRPASLRNLKPKVSSPRLPVCFSR